MLGNFSVLIKAEDIKSNLIASSSKVVDCLQEYIVAVLKGTNVVDGGLYLGGSQIFNRADERFFTCAVSKIVLNIAFV